MTCREKLMKEHPECIRKDLLGGCYGCPDDYEYLPEPDYCKTTISARIRCEKCWDREIPEEKTDCKRGIYKPDPDRNEKHYWTLMNIHYFKETGNVEYLYMALNNIISQYDYIPTMFLEVSTYCEEGIEKYGGDEWQKGIPTHRFIDSAVRNYLKYIRGDADEPHDRAFIWNILSCIWTCVHKPELNEYKKDE